MATIGRSNTKESTYQYGNSTYLLNVSILLSTWSFKEQKSLQTINDFLLFHTALLRQQFMICVVSSVSLHRYPNSINDVNLPISGYTSLKESTCRRALTLFKVLMKMRTIWITLENLLNTSVKWIKSCSVLRLYVRVRYYFQMIS